MIKENKTSAICFGEILWDFLPSGPKPGGAPLNVAYHLNKLGVNSSIVSRIGNDPDGNKLMNLVNHWGINPAFLQSDQTQPTGHVIASLKNGNEVSYEIKSPVAWDFMVNDDKLNATINTDTYLVYGSLAARNQVSRATLYNLLESDGVKVFDINVRPPFINKVLFETLLSKADIVKFNQAELELVQLMFRGSFGQESEQVRFIQDKFMISNVIVTKGEFGASYYTENEQYNTSGREITVRDTVGSGDAFLASFIANHQKGLNPQIIIDLAAQMGAFVASKEGGCPDYNMDEFLNFSTNTF
jgi:fructokinase